MRYPQDNPFRVDRVTTLPFMIDDVAWADILLRVRAANFRGAIVGREGAGKSTLLRAIGRALEAAGLAVTPVTVAAGASHTDRSVATRTAIASADSIIILDGFEQLTWLDRRRLARDCGRLIVTAHETTSLPTLVRLEPRLRTLERVLAQLLEDVTPTARAFATRAFIKRRGDVRETLFDCYDAWAEGRIDGRAGADG